MTMQAETINGDASKHQLEFDLPPFPTTASKLVSELNSPEADVPTVVQLIECEPKVASKVIQLANSPMYGASRPITTIGHGIVLLGFRSVSQLALSLVAGDLFDHPDERCRERLKRTYAKSLAVAIVSRLAAQQLPGANPDEAFLCGVMHDIGKIVFCTSGNDEYLEQCEQLTETQLLRQEEIVFNATHTDIGAQCGRAWGLPQPITTAISDHHTEFESAEDPLTKSIVAGNYFAEKWGLAGEPNESFETSESIENELPSFLEPEFIESCQEQYSEIAKICLG
ncbi:MAG: HDOD domain-containing protein [Aureliella sp.]